MNPGKVKPQSEVSPNDMKKEILHQKILFRNPREFTRFVSGLRLRSYQQGVLEAVLDSVMHDRGYSFVVMFPRQSGKNELQAHLEVYLLTLLSMHPIELVKVSPTLNPQAFTSMRRFEKVARRNLLIASTWKKQGANTYQVEHARITFLSAAPGSNIVGATASGLLEVDEAQQVSIEKYDRDIAPMSASTCATHVFWGTAWTSTTLLGRELRAAEEAEKKDGHRRVFRLTADEVSAEIEAYRRHVEEKIERFGRSHPMVRTQYFSEEVDGEGGMFPAERLALMRGNQAARNTPDEYMITALLLDVAGEDEGVRSVEGSMSLANPARDATALTLVEIGFEKTEMTTEPNGGITQDAHTKGHGPDEARANPGAEASLGVRASLARTERKGHSTLCPYEGGPTLPMYRPIRRWQWIGKGQADLHPLIREIALEWKARMVVVDATGVGAGLTSFLEKALPGRVLPFTFSKTSKSKLGWDFLSVVDSYRWQEPVFADLPGEEQVKFQNEFFKQLAACQFEVKADHAHSMSWQVPEGSRDPESGELLHDDWVFSAALCAKLDEQDWSPASEAFVVSAPDPLDEMDGRF